MRRGRRWFGKRREVAGKAKDVISPFRHLPLSPNLREISMQVVEIFENVSFNWV